MDRRERIEKAFNHSSHLKMTDRFYSNWFEEFIDFKLKGDEIENDITTLSLMIPTHLNGHVALIAKDNGIVAGIEEIKWLYEKYNLDVKVNINDGEMVTNGDIILEMSGSRKYLLELERLGLNIVQRMSGIATLTNRIVTKAKTYGNTKVAATRKTLWRFLDKKAVAVGGGYTHRLHLADGIMIKDNHLSFMKMMGFENYIAEAIRRAWEYRKNANFIEIELSKTNEIYSTAQLLKDYAKRSDIPLIIMLDNLSPKKIETIVSELKIDKLYDSVLIEASGNININNVSEYSTVGVDVMSMGFVTHSAKNFDISQKVLI